LGKSFDKVLMGAAGGSTEPDANFNTVSFLSHFEGANNGVNNVFDDESDSNHTITAVSTINQSSFSPFSRPDGEWANSFYVGSSIKFPASSDFAFGTGNFTVECFVFLHSWAGDAVMVDFRPTNGAYTDTFSFSLTTNGNPVFYTDQSNALGGTVSLHAWHHLALVKTSGVMKVYIDGTGQNAVSNSVNWSRNGAPSIGATKSGLSNSGSLDGFVSNVRVVKGTAVYTSDFTAPTSALTAITNTKLLTCQNNRFVDNSASAHAVTVVGIPLPTPFGPILTKAYDPAVNGGSAIGSGSQYLTAASSSDFAIGTSDFCIEMWLFPTATPDAALEIPFSTRRTAGGNYMFLHYDNNQISIGTSGAFKLNLATTAIKPVQWNHVCWARSSGVSMAFINGVKIGQANDTTDYLQEGVTVFGVGNDQQYTGNMACFRFVNGSNPRGTSTFAIPTTAPTAVTNTKLLLNMANAQVFDNAAINTLTLTGHANTSTDQAKFGTTSLHLDGTDDLVALSGHHVFGTGDYTVEMFVYHTSISGQQTYFSDPNGNNAGVYFYKDSNNKLGLYYAGQIVTGSGNVPANQWAHVAVCRASGTSRLFLDGVLQGSASDTTNLTETTYSIGNSVGASNEFIGYIDDIRVSKVARYTANFTPATEPFPDKGR